MPLNEGLFLATEGQRPSTIPQRLWDRGAQSRPAHLRFFFKKVGLAMTWPSVQDRRDLIRWLARRAVVVFAHAGGSGDADQCCRGLGVGVDVPEGRLTKWRGKGDEAIRGVPL